MSSHPSFLYLNRNQVASLLPPIGEQIDLAERCYRSMASGAVELPPKPGIHPRPDTFIHAMPAYLKDQDVAALKWVAGYPQNKDRGLPYISGLIVLNDPETGLPLSVMDAAEITAARTAAASGVCIRRWAPQGWAQAAILGCGEQGQRHAQVLSHLNPAVRIRGYDIDPERAARLPGRVEPRHDAREAVEQAEVIITAGPIVEHPEPVIERRWLRASYLLLPIDFDSYVQADAIREADLLLVDDADQFEYYRDNGHFTDWPIPDASVGDALLRALDGERVACCNLGVGSLDAVFGKYVFDHACTEGIGTRLSL